MRKWLAEIRTTAKKSQQKVAGAASISQSYYAGIELGIMENPLAVPVAKRIAAALGFDWTRLYNEDDEGRFYHSRGRKSRATPRKMDEPRT